TAAGPLPPYSFFARLFRPDAPLLAVRFFGGALHVGMPPAQQQAARWAHARPNQPEVRGRVEQARIPLHPARQQPFDLLAQARRVDLAGASHRARIYTTPLAPATKQS